MEQKHELKDFDSTSGYMGGIDELILICKCKYEFIWFSPYQKNDIKIWNEHLKGEK